MSKMKRGEIIVSTLTQVEIVLKNKTEQLNKEKTWLEKQNLTKWSQAKGAKHWTFFCEAQPLVPKAGFHCPSNHVLSANPLKAYMSHHNHLLEWNDTVTKPFSLEPQSRVFGTLAAQEERGGPLGAEAFVAGGGISLGPNDGSHANIAWQRFGGGVDSINVEKPVRQDLISRLSYDTKEKQQEHIFISIPSNVSERRAA